jgi:hypothetical protein
MDRPEYFVVRLYRRTPDDPQRIEGMVEVVASGTHVAFANVQELWTILLQAALTPDRMQPE